MTYFTNWNQTHLPIETTRKWGIMYDTLFIYWTAGSTGLESQREVNGLKLPQLSSWSYFLKGSTGRKSEINRLRSHSKKFDIYQLQCPIRNFRQVTWPLQGLN